MNKYSYCKDCWKLRPDVCDGSPDAKCQFTEALKPYPFQREDADRMASMPNTLQFSEMRTGKTIVSIISTWEQKQWPTVIICPGSLKLNWWDEIYKWTNTEPFYAETLDELVNGFMEGLETGEMPKYFIIHHEALAYTTKDPIREVFPKIKWRCTIIDESHQFRNPNTNRADTLKDMKDYTKKFVFVTGTPIVNSPFDLYLTLKLTGLAKEDEGRFLDHYTWGRSTQYGYKISGNRNQDELLTLMAPIYIRRTQKEVGMEMPTEQTIRLVMPADQKEAYEHYEEMMCMLLDGGMEISSSNILSLTTRLRQLSLDPRILGKDTKSSKTTAVLELVSQNKDKWVVSSTSEVWVQLMAERMKDECLTLTGRDFGSFSKHEKVRKFNTNPNIKVLLTTIFTGGLGLNLSSANNIIIADPWWQGVIIQQQADRVRSLTQTKPVFIYKLVNEGTVDEDMYAKIASKVGMANEVVVEQEVIKSIYRRRRGVEYYPKAADVSPEKEGELEGLDEYSGDEVTGDM